MDRAQVGFEHFNRGNELYEMYEFAGAATEYEAAWQIWGVELKEHQERDNHRATLLMN